jgi:hypothetical protein
MEQATAKNRKNQMENVNYPNGVLRTSEHQYSFLGVSPSNTPRQAEDFQMKVAEEIPQMRCNEFEPDVSKDFDEMDLQDHMITEPDDFQPLTVKPPLTLLKIFSKLTTLERLWLARMVKPHGKETGTCSVADLRSPHQLRAVPSLFGVPFEWPREL